MEDMIGRIIELDKKARDDVSRARQLKLDSEQKISALKEKKRSEYINRARIDIKEREKDEKIKACIKLSAVEGIYRKKIQRIEKIYSENKEKWVSTIISRVKAN